jgi:hypothetical protein
MVNVPNKVVKLSAASRNSEVATFCSASTGTSTNDLFRVSRKVPPGGYALAAAIFAIDFVVFVKKLWCTR